jgi:hypothetical protein
MRILFILFIALLSVFIFLQLRSQKPAEQLPVFLRADGIADEHDTDIDIRLHSRYKPAWFELDKLRKDYSDLWAHLNHLYSTNDVEAGKEYYTEDWFKQICSHYETKQEASIIRTDSAHQLNIINWASDGLVFTAIDSNVVLKYQYKDKSTKTTISDIAVVLLFQGDHWRLDAIRIINEKEIFAN